MRVFDFSFLCSIFLLAGWAVPFTYSTTASSLRGDRNVEEQDRSLQVRTDMIRLIPFQVQLAIQDETTAEDSKVFTETLYGGTILTDTITDWLAASYIEKTTNQAEQLLVNNYTTFDSIAIEKVNDSTSTGTIDGQEMSLTQLSIQGVTLWEREGTGTPPMEPEIVELIQRATFLEDRSLKNALQTTVNTLLFDLGIDSVNGVQPVTVVDVRAYITPPGSTTDNDGISEANKNLEIIIIVAIVVACLAFALLLFAVIWAWRSDRQDRADKSSSSRKQRRSIKPKPPTPEPAEKDVSESKKETERTAQQTQSSNVPSYPQSSDTDAPVSQASSYDLPHDGSYPKEIGNIQANGNMTDYPDDSVISEDISSSLSAYYKSGMGYGNNNVSSARGIPPNTFNDAASISSMDSYGYSLDGYAPSLGPAQGGYPIGTLQAAKDAAVPVGDGSSDGVNIKQLQDDESISDYKSELPLPKLDFA